MARRKRKEYRICFKTDATILNIGGCCCCCFPALNRSAWIHRHGIAHGLALVVSTYALRCAQQEMIAHQEERR
jgi:hypothetical protein